MKGCRLPRNKYCSCSSCLAKASCTLLSTYPTSARALAILHQLSRQTAKDAALKVVGSMKPSTNANENATAETNPLSTLPNSRPQLRLRRVKRLRSGCTVELGVIVEVILDGQIALARGLREPRDVEDANFSAGVFDKSFSLGNPGCR